MLLMNNKGRTRMRKVIATEYVTLDQPERKE